MSRLSRSNVIKRNSAKSSKDWRGSLWHQAPFLFYAFQAKTALCKRPLHRFVSLIDLGIKYGVTRAIHDRMQLMQEVRRDAPTSELGHHSNKSDGQFTIVYH